MSLRVGGVGVFVGLGVLCECECESVGEFAGGWEGVFPTGCACRKTNTECA